MTIFSKPVKSLACALALSGCISYTTPVQGRLLRAAEVVAPRKSTFKDIGDSPPSSLHKWFSGDHRTNDEDFLGETDNPDLFDVIGLDCSASDAEIAKTVKKAVLRHHPDKGGNPADFRAAKVARKVFTDQKLKEGYLYLRDINAHFRKKDVDCKKKKAERDAAEAEEAARRAEEEAAAAADEQVDKDQSDKASTEPTIPIREQYSRCFENRSGRVRNQYTSAHAFQTCTRPDAEALEKLHFATATPEDLVEALLTLKVKPLKAWLENFGLLKVCTGMSKREMVEELVLKDGERFKSVLNLNFFRNVGEAESEWRKMELWALEEATKEERAKAAVDKVAREKREAHITKMQDERFAHERERMAAAEKERLAKQEQREKELAEQKRREAEEQERLAKEKAEKDKEAEEWEGLAEAWEGIEKAVDDRRRAVKVGDEVALGVDPKFCKIPSLQKKMKDLKKLVLKGRIEEVHDDGKYYTINFDKEDKEDKHISSLKTKLEKYYYVNYSSSYEKLKDVNIRWEFYGDAETYKSEKTIGIYFVRQYFVNGKPKMRSEPVPETDEVDSEESAFPFMQNAAPGKKASSAEKASPSTAEEASEKTTSDEKANQKTPASDRTPYGGFDVRMSKDQILKLKLKVNAEFSLKSKTFKKSMSGKPGIRINREFFPLEREHLGEIFNEIALDGSVAGEEPQFNITHVILEKKAKRRRRKNRTNVKVNNFDELVQKLGHGNCVGVVVKLNPKLNPEADEFVPEFGKHYRRS